MIKIEKLCDELNKGINNELTQQGIDDLAFLIYPDSGDYAPPVKINNKIYRKIYGTARIVDSSIVPIAGLSVATITLDVNFAARIDESAGVESSLEIIRSAVATYMSTPKQTDMQGDGKTYKVSMYGTQPEMGMRDSRAQLGDSVDYSFSCMFSFVENGVNSLELNIEVEVPDTEGNLVYENVYSTETTIVRAPVSDGSAFSDSNGNVKNWNCSTMFEIGFLTPALSDSGFTQALYEFIMNGTEKQYNVRISSPLGVNTYVMQFSQSNLTSRGVDNIGFTVKMIESLIVPDDLAEVE